MKHDWKRIRVPILGTRWAVQMWRWKANGHWSLSLNVRNYELPGDKP